MKKNILGKLLIILVLISLGIFRAEAEKNIVTETSIGVSPAILESILEPGKSNTTKVTVFNTTNIPLPIKGSVRSFIPKEHILEGKEKSEMFDASRWIQIEPSDFILQPQEQKEVTVTISTPETAEPGGHYATIYFQPLIPAEYISAGNTLLTARVGIITLFNVKGDVDENAEIVSLQAKSLTNNEPVEFELTTQNTGNVHLLMSGIIEIKDIQGNMIGEVVIDPSFVIPQTEKILIGKLDKKWLIGKFTAQAKIKYGSANEEKISPKITFYKIPIFPIVTTLILLTVLVTIFIILRSRLLPAIKVLIGKDTVHYTKPTISKKNIKGKKTKKDTITTLRG